MLRLPATRIPPPPGAGLTKIADPRRVALAWLVCLALALAVGAVTWPLGVGRCCQQLRRQYAALGYLREAGQAAQARPARRAEALAALRRAVALAPDHPIVTETAAGLYIDLRAYAEAIPWLRREAASSLEARASLGHCLLLTGQTAEGAGLLSQVLRQANAERRAATMPRPRYASLLNHIGYAHALAGTSLPEARTLIASALRLDPGRWEVIDSLGWVEYRLGNYTEAAFHLERAVRLGLPAESAEVYYHLGAAYARLGRKQEARVYLQRCLRLDPSWAEAGRQLRELGQDLPDPAFVDRPWPVRPQPV